MVHKILIMGLPGSGKTALAKRLAPMLRAAWYDGDYVREYLWPELGFSRTDRIENARRIGTLCDIANVADHNAVASFICPTPETRTAFNASYTIWIDRIQQSRFEDTNKMFVPPDRYDLKLWHGEVNDWLEAALYDILYRDDPALAVRWREVSRIALDLVPLRLRSG